MNAGDWFVSSVVGWFADQPDGIMDAIADESDIPLHGVFFPAEVDDATLSRSVPTAVAQRLLRWSTARPNDVFLHGFPLAVIPEINTFPQGAFNLRE